MTVSVRYIVDDAEAVAGWYRDALGFEVEMAFGPGFAAVRRGELRLLLNAPGAGGAGQAADDGSAPAPGGWNRIQLDVDDVEAEVDRLRAAGVTCRTSPLVGNGGAQAVVEDPAGNPIELFAPA